MGIKNQRAFIRSADSDNARWYYNYLEGKLLSGKIPDKLTIMGVYF
jgi:hypothetical protein